MLLHSLLFCIATGSINALTLEEIAAAHESATGQLHSLDVKYALSYPKPGRPSKKSHWIREGTKERMVLEQRLLTPEGGIPFRSDAFMDGTKYHLMAGTGWDSTTKKLPKGAQIQNFIEPPPAVYFDISGPNDFLLSFQIAPNDVRRSLRDFVREKNATYLGDVDVSGHLTHHIRLTHPGVVDQSTGKLESVGSTLDVYLDPEKGFFPRRVDKTLAQDAGTLAKHGFEVKEYMDIGRGVYFPKLIECFKGHLGEKGELLFRQTTESALINRPLASDAFAYRFLEGMLVTVEHAPGEGQETWLQIGKDGKIERELLTPDEVSSLRKAMTHSKDTATSRRWFWIVLGIVPIVVLFVLIWRRRKGQLAK